MWKQIKHLNHVVCVHLKERNRIFSAWQEAREAQNLVWRSLQLCKTGHHHNLSWCQILFQTPMQIGKFRMKIKNKVQIAPVTMWTCLKGQDQAVIFTWIFLIWGQHPKRQLFMLIMCLWVTVCKGFMKMSNSFTMRS